MREVKRFQANKIFPFVSEILEQGLRVRIAVTGMSMYPFLRENIDSVEFNKPNWENINRGDIVLTLRDNGMYILHRVFRKEKECFFILGDAQQWIEGPLRPDQLVAKVMTVWRNNNRINCDNIIWRLLIIIWRIMLPFRYNIINIYKYLRRIIFRRGYKEKSKKIQEEGK